MNHTQEINNSSNLPSKALAIYQLKLETLYQKLAW